MSLPGSASNPIDVDSLYSTTDSETIPYYYVPLYRFVKPENIDKIYRYNPNISRGMSIRDRLDEENTHHVMCILKVNLTFYGDLYVVQKLTVADENLRKPYKFEIESTKAIYYNKNTQDMTTKMNEIVGKSEMKYAKYYKNLIMETAREMPLVCALTRKDFKDFFGMSPKGLTREMYRDLSFDINDMKSLEDDSGYDPLCPSYCSEGAKSSKKIKTTERDHMKKVIRNAAEVLLRCSGNESDRNAESIVRYSTRGAKASLFLDSDRDKIGIFVDFPLGEFFFFRVKQWLYMDKPEKPYDHESYSKDKMELSLYGNVYNEKGEKKFQKIEWVIYALPDNLCVGDKAMPLDCQRMFFEALNQVKTAWNDYAISDAKTLLEGLTECKENLQDFFADNF